MWLFWCLEFRPWLFVNPPILRYFKIDCERTDEFFNLFLPDIFCPLVTLKEDQDQTDQDSENWIKIGKNGSRFCLNIGARFQKNFYFAPARQTSPDP
jgi:hypothetical protein